MYKWLILQGFAGCAPGGEALRDLTGIGGNHFIHAARRNMDMLVILVNNFIYGMTGGQNAPTTPLTARSSTMPFGNFERPFNLPARAASCAWVQPRDSRLRRTRRASAPRTSAPSGWVRGGVRSPMTRVPLG